MAFVSAMKNFFGYGTPKGAVGSASTFLTELRELTFEEKQQFHSMLVAQPGFENTQAPIVPKG